MTKVLHILHELKFSGAEIMYVDAAKYFQKLGCQLFVINTAENLGEYATLFEKADYKIYHMPYPRLRHYIQRIKYYCKVIKLIKKNNIDVVHIHRNDAFWGMSLCAKIANIKSIHTFHNVFQEKGLFYLYQIGLRLSAKYLFQCKFQTISDSVYFNELKYFHNKTIKIYNWFGNNRFYPAEYSEKQRCREKLNIPNNSLVLISIGGCSNIKQHEEIIKAFSIILKTNPNCIYLHLGKGELEIEEKKLSKKLHVDENIRFLGNQLDVRSFLIASDIYLMTSKHEGIPITTIEAMACKIPSILYDVPGLKDFNADGENCVLIPSDYKTLAQSILHLYLDVNYREKIANNGKNLVESKFWLDTNCKKIFDLYNS